MATSESMSVGIVVERRESDHPWEDHVWQVVSVIPGAADTEDWAELGRGDGWVRYHAATLPVELFRKETEGYKHNLSLEEPSVFVVLREADVEDEGDHDVVPFLATVCPYEAQDYMDTGEESVQTVPMPEPIAAWMATYIETHHIDEPFIKRKRKPFDPRREGFDRPAPRVPNKWNQSSHD